VRRGDVLKHVLQRVVVAPRGDLGCMHEKTVRRGGRTPRSGLVK